MRVFTSALVATCLLSGCQTVDDALTSNSTPVAVAGPAASAIAGDMAGRFAEQAGPPATLRMGDDRSDHAQALEAALKGWGYAIAKDGEPARKQETIELAYSIERIDGQVLARLTTPSLALGRAYTTTEAGATPASPLSIMHRD